MKSEEQKPIVISLGGSLIVPEKVNSKFLKDFKRTILAETKKGHRFFIICGGGKTARVYGSGLKEITKTDQETEDWMGIYATKLNAELVRLMFGNNAYEKIVSKPEDLTTSTKKPLVIASGYKPGGSSDFATVTFAKKIGATKIINLSNIDYAYDSDPRTNPNAKKIESINWKEFRKIIPKKWSPGISSPFDPTASQIAEKEKMSVAIINGTNFTALKNYISDKNFIGTLIS